MVQQRDAFLSGLFDQEYPKLIRLAYRLTGSMEMAQDLVQETFLLAVVRYEELTAHPKVGGWLTMTMYNLARNERRRYERHPEIPLESVINVSKEDQPRSLEELLPYQLSASDREILIWRYALQLDYPDIASRLGISEKACRMRVSRSLKRCKEILESSQ